MRSGYQAQDAEERNFRVRFRNRVKGLGFMVRGLGFTV